MNAYSPEVERKMKWLFDSLRENDQRRYAAVEATKLGHGGIEYVARVLKCDPKTIRRGLVELEEADELDSNRIRKKGVDGKSSSRSVLASKRTSWRCFRITPPAIRCGPM